MDRQVLAQQMRQQFQAVVQRVSEQASSSRQDMAQMEQAIYAACDQLKADLLQTWVDQARDDSDRPTCPHCDGAMRQKQRVSKTSACVGGQVTVQRTRWWCRACSASFFPSG